MSNRASCEQSLHHFATEIVSVRAETAETCFGFGFGPTKQADVSSINVCTINQVLEYSSIKYDTECILFIVIAAMNDFECLGNASFKAANITLWNEFLGERHVPTRSARRLLFRISRIVTTASGHFSFSGDYIDF